MRNFQNLSIDEKVAVVVQHSFNTIIMLVETFMITDIKVDWYDFMYVDAFLILYVVVIVLVKVKLNIDWPYPFFEYLEELSSAVLSIIGLIILGEVGFLMTRGLLKLRKREYDPLENDDSPETNEHHTL